MNFNITRTSDWDFSEQKEINTLEELMLFIKNNGSCIITHAAEPYVKIHQIEIYDDYRE